ncbi:MAG: LysR family transcriptional regulator [Microvirga sp.]
MELRHLRVFVAVTRGGSFTAAADDLHMVQSAVSSTVRNLENELGVTLFDRTTRRVALTDAGRILLPEAERTLESAALAMDAVEQAKGGVRGSVTVGTMQAAAVPNLSVASFIARFGETHPDVKVAVRHVSRSTDLAEHVRDGSVDLGILSLPDPTAGLIRTPLSKERMSLACAPGHRLAGRAGIVLSELGEETFVDGPSGWGIRMATDRAFIDAGASRTVSFEVNDTLGILDFVRIGLAVALLPASMTTYAPELRVVPIRGHAPTFATFLAEPAARRPTAASRAFATFVRAIARTDDAALGAA